MAFPSEDEPPKSAQSSIIWFEIQMDKSVLFWTEKNSLHKVQAKLPSSHLALTHLRTAGKAPDSAQESRAQEPGPLLGPELRCKQASPNPPHWSPSRHRQSRTRLLKPCDCFSNILKTMAGWDRSSVVECMPSPGCDSQHCKSNQMNSGFPSLWAPFFCGEGEWTFLCVSRTCEWSLAQLPSLCVVLKIGMLPTTGSSCLLAQQDGSPWLCACSF